ncbi:hypothetical protein DLAC_08619 [Tieghemostelium lacteum]|uniref:Uncharacterized protein n=1 Tax=Tieghemostelium lacteum TaxID=361077 RepID=A0A151Z7X4_TIELA|nr:hypothetical protein DLAC_08619 [Tieghemostelium lacteum]|eukprot:KYQ90035.1 hypothetical protein DLAC_08619 [Tieghemostelium lacteum]
MTLNKVIKTYLKGTTESVFSDRVSKILFKSKLIAVIVVATILLALIRDLIVFVIKLPMDNNYRHLSIFFTFVLETIQSLIVMNAIAETPINYILFQRINSDIPKYESPEIKLSKLSMAASRSNTIDLGQVNISSSTDSFENPLSDSSTPLHHVNSNNILPPPQEV